MALGSLRLVIIQSFIVKVIATYTPYQYAGTPYSSPTYYTSYPAQSYASPAYQQYTQPVYPQNTAGYVQPTPTYKPAAVSANPVGPTPTKGPTAYQATSYLQPPKATPIAPTVPLIPKIEPKLNPLPKDTLTNPKETAPFDSNILNNLAIALQLLIVSNLIHNSPGKIPKDIDEDMLPDIVPLPMPFIPQMQETPKTSYEHQNDYSQYSIPNANFLGSSGFGESGLSKSMISGYGAPTHSAPRPTGLMSPYDSIAKHQESRSPYHLSSDFNDLFSLTELFKV